MKDILKAQESLSGMLVSALQSKSLECLKKD
jgi:hypothetical protein